VNKHIRSLQKIPKITYSYPNDNHNYTLFDNLLFYNQSRFFDPKK